MDRRTFLGTAAVAPLVFGLEELLGQEPESPSWYAVALKRMKETGRDGVVVIVPPDPKGRLALGKHLHSLLSDDAAAQALFCEAVFIFVAPELMVVGEIRAVGETANRFLLDPQGKRVEADTVSTAAFATPERFVASFRPFLRGKDDRRLKEKHKALWKGLTEEVKGAFGRLDAEEAEQRDIAAGILKRHRETLIPCLVHEGIYGPTTEARGRARDLVLAYFRESREDSPGPRRPHGCEPGAHYDDPCPSCGLGRAGSESRSFLGFLRK